MSDAAYQLKVSLRDISPMIWWRLLVSADLNSYGLHRAIQIAFGKDHHLHAFELHGRRHGAMWTGERHHHADGREASCASGWTPARGGLENLLAFAGLASERPCGLTLSRSSPDVQKRPTPDQGAGHKEVRR